MLSGVDRENWLPNQYKHCSVINFVLDGQTYTAVENVIDDYRGMLGEIFISGHLVQNAWKPVYVTSRLVMDRYGSKTVEFKYSDNDPPILIVGEDNSDSYYPMFICHFNPTLLPQNKPRKPKETRKLLAQIEFFDGRTISLWRNKKI